MTFTVYPAVDISDGRCVRLLQGEFGTETVYSDDPVEVALDFCAAGARWLHVVDLDGAKTGEPRNRDLVLEVAGRASCPVQAGGGLRSIEDVESMLAAGASRAVLGTLALEDPHELERACKRHGDRLAVSLDVRGGDVAAHGWTVGSGVSLPEAVRTFERLNVATFVYTDVTRDGTMEGPNVDALLECARLTSVPVIASGGISSLRDLQIVAALRAQGVTGAIIGRALYERRFTVAEANDAVEDRA